MQTISINEKYNSFWARFRSTFINYLIVFATGFLFVFIIYGWKTRYLLLYSLFVVAGLLYCAWVNITVLKSISFNIKQRVAEVEVMRFSKVKYKYSIGFDECKIAVRRKLLSRNQPWVLKVYRKNALIFQQDENGAWTYEQFLVINKISDSVL